VRRGKERGFGQLCRAFFILLSALVEATALLMITTIHRVYATLWFLRAWVQTGGLLYNFSCLIPLGAFIYFYFFLFFSKLGFPRWISGKEEGQRPC